jgi:signal transduction histidine kinase
VAKVVLGGETSITEAVEKVVTLLSSYEGVDLVAASLIVLNPEDATGWVHLGERAWLREWSRPGTTCSVAPRQGAGADHALSLPWLSQIARTRLVVVADTDLLPEDAEQDRRELTACGVRALVSSAVMSEGSMFGSVAIAAVSPGLWPEGHLADVQMLSAALGSRISAARAREALADAIRRGDLARGSQQEFFSAIGHELRTPIAAIVQTAELLGADASDLVATAGDGPLADFAGSVTKDAGVVLSAGEQLLAVVDELLETGQELGGGAGSEWVDVADAIGDVIHWVRTPALSARVTVSSDVERGTRVLTTASGLRQILTNLVGNAVLYNTPGGTVRITTSRTRDEFGDPRVRISVQDTGPGLTIEQQRDVFKPFVRFAGDEVKGTGLGLSLSRSLAERDGGMTGVESTPGEGSVFWLDLPAAPHEARESAS